MRVRESTKIASRALLRAQKRDSCFDDLCFVLGTFEKSVRPARCLVKQFFNALPRPLYPQKRRYRALFLELREWKFNSWRGRSENRAARDASIAIFILATTSRLPVILCSLCAGLSLPFPLSLSLSLSVSLSRRYLNIECITIPPHAYGALTRAIYIAETENRGIIVWS